jgi:hypothetical protein
MINHEFFLNILEHKKIKQFANKKSVFLVLGNDGTIAQRSIVMLEYEY